MSRYGLGIDVGDQTITAAICHLEDHEFRSEPLRLDTELAGRPPHLGGLPAPHLLARVGDPTPLYDVAPSDGAPTDIRPRTAVELLADLVARVRQHSETVEGETPELTVLAVPPSWGEHRRAEVTAALTAAVGENTCTLASSAVAATRHHRATAGSADVGTVAVYDLGASTVDTAVVRATESGTLEHAAVPPPPCAWGGRDIDDAVLEHVGKALGFPERTGATLPGDRARLTALRSACVAAKEKLSTELVTRVDVSLPRTDGSVRLVRADLDELIAGSVAESVAVVRDAVTDAGLAPDDLDGVILTGGGAVVPLVAETLSAELEVPLLVSDRPALTVACGAAELAADLMAVEAEPAAADDDSDDWDDHWDDDPANALVLHTGGHPRERGTPRRGPVRIGIVAALLLALLVTPLSLMGALDDGVSTRSAQGVAAAEEAPAPTPAPTGLPAAPTEGAVAAERAADASPSTADASPSTADRAPRPTPAPSTAAAAAPAPTTTPTTAPAPPPTPAGTPTTTPTPETQAPVTPPSTPPAPEPTEPSPTGTDPPPTDTPTDTPTTQAADPSVDSQSTEPTGGTP